MSKIKIKVTLFGNFGGILAGFRHHGEQLVHFVCRFDIELVGLELHFIRILNGLAGLDAEQDALHFGILLAQIVGVVGGAMGMPVSRASLMSCGSTVLSSSRPWS